MRAGVHEFVEDVDVREALVRVGHRELPRIRIRAQDAHGQTRRVRVVLRPSLVAQLLCPRQHRQLTGLEAAVLLDVVHGTAAHPRPRQIDLAVRQTRDWLAAGLGLGHRRAARVDEAHAVLGRESFVLAGVVELSAHGDGQRQERGEDENGQRTCHEAR